MSDTRLVNIESKVAYQEVLIQELNTVVFEQQKQIDHHEKTIARLLEQIRELSESFADGESRGDAPPHY